MKTTLTDKDFDRLSFSAGLLQAAGHRDMAAALGGLVERQRALKDDEPDAGPPPMDGGTVAGVLPQAFRFIRRSTGGSIIADFDRRNGVAGWRTSADPNQRRQQYPGGGWYTEQTVRERLASGAWKYKEAVPPLKSVRYESPGDIVDPMRRMEEKVRKVEASEVFKTMTAPLFYFKVSNTEADPGTYRAERIGNGFEVTNIDKPNSLNNRGQHNYKSVAENLQSGDWVVVERPLYKRGEADKGVRRGC